MRIAIDLSPLYSNHQFRGIGFYTKRLVEAYESIKDEVEFEFIKDTDKLRTTKADLIHYPYFSPFFLSLPRTFPIPVVVTVHDLIPIKYKNHFPAGIKGNIRWEIQKRRLRKVSAILTDSHVWKKEIGHLVDYPQNKIFVVPLAAGNDFRVKTDYENLKVVKKKLNLPDKYILYVGDVNWHKNIIGLVKAFKYVANQHPEYSLILVGKVFENLALPEVKVIRKNISLCRLEKQVRFLGWVEDDDLISLYNLATVYCQPSFDEGFGLPVLEAMACGCPTVVSNSGSLPEVSGNASLLVNPALSEDMANGILRIINNKSERDNYIKKGLHQAACFTWQKTAINTIDVYKNIIG